MRGYRRTGKIFKTLAQEKSQTKLTKRLKGEKRK